MNYACAFSQSELGKYFESIIIYDITILVAYTNHHFLGTWLEFPGWDLSHFAKFGTFCGYSLNTLKYPKTGICYFFLCFKPLFVRIFQFHFYFSPSADKISLPFSVALALRKANFCSP